MSWGLQCWWYLLACMILHITHGDVRKFPLLWLWPVQYVGELACYLTKMCLHRETWCFCSRVLVEVLLTHTSKWLHYITGMVSAGSICLGRREEGWEMISTAIVCPRASVCVVLQAIEVIQPPSAKPACGHANPRPGTHPSPNSCTCPQQGFLTCPERKDLLLSEGSADNIKI